MNERTIEFDIYLCKRPAGAYGQILADPSISVLGADIDDARRRVVELAREIAERQHDRIEAAALPPPEERHVRLTIPASSMGRMLELRPSLLVVTYTLPSGYRAVLPALDTSFEVADRDELTPMLLEHIRERYSLGTRMEVFAPYTGEGENDERTERASVRVPAVEPDTEEGGPETPTLEAVGDPLHLRLDRRDAPRAFERDAEAEVLLEHLGGVSDRSVLLVGPSGAGKTAVVQEVVARILEGSDATLEDTGVWQISGGRLMAGMRFLGQWQQRVLALIDEARETGAILYAENLVELVEASGDRDRGPGIAGMLLPAIRSGDIVVVTEARPGQIAFVEQRHPGFLRALRRLSIDPMDAARTDTVLRRISFRLGREIGVRLGESTRQTILELVERFDAGRALPGPAAELAERVARTHQRFAERAENEPRPTLRSEDAIDAYSSMTGLPAELLDPSMAFDLEEVEDYFASRIFAQPEALEAIVDLVAVVRAGIAAPRRPMGSFLFVGPTGVGKTQTAIALAEYLFGSERRLLRFDMSEYQDRWSAGRLVGRVRGEAGELTRKVREHPFQVLLLDEIEKAHSTVFDYLLQILGEGRLTDALGQTVSLSNAVVIMTSNLGASGPASLGFASETDERARRERAEAHYLGEVENFFRPEFVGRVDRVIPFRPLGIETARRLVRTTLEESFAREGLRRRGLEVEVSEEVVDHLVEIGFDARYGARPLRQTVERLVTAALGEFLAERGEMRDERLVLEMGQGKPEIRSSV